MSKTKTFTEERFLEILEDAQNFSKINVCKTLLTGFRMADPIMIKEKASEDYVEGWRAAMDLVRHTTEAMISRTPKPDGADEILNS